MNFITVLHMQMGERDEKHMYWCSFKICSRVCAALWREDMEEEVSLHSFWGVGTPPILQLPSAGAAHPCCSAQAPAASKVAAVSLFPDLLSMAKFQSKINSKISKSFHIYLNSGFKLKPRWVLLSSRPTSPWLCFLTCKMGEIRTWLL